ncbi:hypothetical protein D6856_14685 [Butyrivibrio sp. XB500-5]|uniref:hypothetical protein n=1 Tax=Butyrivibrio sp. XB500-5 TaxID=2364880 RepID=UPI000EA9B67D|nr:hypothetical protein [Butyrivibrio sp. XB500-5]RKM56740.1 hypothetical protein D6856_14685 [Butyrivibrio sp. XB500-5]
MNKNKKSTIDKIMSSFGRICGLILLLFGISILVIAVIHSDEVYSLKMFFLGYMFALIGAGICVILSSNCSSTTYSVISGKGFFICALFPFAVITAVLLIPDSDFSSLNSKTGNTWLIAHALLTGAWFIQKIIIKIKEKKTWQEIELMRIDLYSTVSMVPLTLIWVIFKLDVVEVGFATLLGEFLIIQFLVKIALIKLKERSENCKET